MSRQQEKDFPTLSGQGEQSQQKGKKAQKQISYEKDNSVQLNGMNDLLGFYYEGDAKQQGPTSNSRAPRQNYNNKQENYNQGENVQRGNRGQQQQQGNQNRQGTSGGDYQRQERPSNQKFSRNQGGQQNNQSNQVEGRGGYVQKQNNNPVWQEQSQNDQRDYDRMLQNDLDEYDNNEEDTYQKRQNQQQQPQQQQQYQRKYVSGQNNPNDQQYERKVEYQQKQYEVKQPSNNRDNNTQMTNVNSSSNNNKSGNDNNKSGKQSKLVFVEKESAPPQQQKTQTTYQPLGDSQKEDKKQNQTTQQKQGGNQYVRKDQSFQQQEQFQPRSEQPVVFVEKKTEQNSEQKYVQKYQESGQSSQRQPQQQQQFSQKTSYAPEQQQNKSQNNNQYVPKQNQSSGSFVEKQPNDQYNSGNSDGRQSESRQNNNNNNQRQNNKRNQNSNNNKEETGRYQEKQQQQQQQNFKQNEDQQKKSGQSSQGQKKELKAVNARQREQEKAEVSNEWNTDVNKYINKDQVFYMNEDRIYHVNENKYNGTRRGALPKVLMVAEKPSISRSIAEALSNGKFESCKGYSKFLPVYEFEGMFQNKRVLFRVTSVAGHVYGLDFTNENQSWGKVNPVNLFTARTIKVDSNPSTGMIKHLEIEAQDASYLLLWLDNDREGENICFEVKHICERVMCYEGGSNVQVLRAKFSSLTKPDLQQAFKNIRDPPNILESKATDARQIIDLKIGSAFTRYQTLFFRNKYPELTESIISFGPCQTPTLGFCVSREDEILSFKPRLYFRVRLSFLTEDVKEIVAHCDRGHIFNQQEATKIYNEISTSREVSIENLTSDNSSKQRPEGLNTVQLLKVGSSYLQLSPIDTMHIAERLYLAGYITYPRTESTAYPKTFDFEEIIESLTQDPDYGKHAKGLLENSFTKPRSGVDMGDHPPITPTFQYPDGLRGDEVRLYDYIARHFIASLSEDCKYKKIAITAKTQGYTFIARGIQLIKKGFMEVLDSVSLGENAIASNLKIGDKLKVGSSSLEQEYTSAPGFITESELIGLMEKNKIGTDASMATHIQNICNRKYVEISGSGRALVPTELGRSLIHGYQKIDPDLVQPQIRAKIESLVDAISTGTKQFNEVINESMQIFQAKYLTFVENISKMDFLFSSFCTTFEDTLDAAKPFSKCGKCKRFMKIIERAGKIICEKCDISLSIPTNGKFKLAGEKFCPLDGYQVMFFTSLHTPNVSFEVCPKCYTDSPILDSDQVTCSICTNDACKLSINHRLLKECPQCQVGDIVIEPVVAQKLAAMCNECWTQWCVPIQTKELQVNKEKACSKCTSKLISFKHIVTQLKQAPAKPGEPAVNKEKQQRIIKFSKTEFQDVCLFCDPELQEECHQVEYHESRRRRNQRRKRRQ